MDSNIQFIINSLKKHSEVTNINYDSSNDWLIVNRKRGISFYLGVMSQKIINLSDIHENCLKRGLNFLVNIPKEPYVHGNVLETLKLKEISFGGIGDLFRYINQEDNYPYVNPEVAFILRGISQHTEVSNIKRLDSRRYEIERYSHKTVIILALNDYDLSVESVRTGKELYKDFNVILSSNPNARVTSEALYLAKDLKIRILKFGQLLGYLND
jgi:hypothetical protein